MKRSSRALQDAPECCLMSQSCPGIPDLVAYIMRVWHKHNRSKCMWWTKSGQGPKISCAFVILSILSQTLFGNYAFSLNAIIGCDRCTLYLTDRILDYFGTLRHCMVLEHSHLPFYMLLTAYKPARIYMYFRFFLANKLREEASTNPRGQPHNIQV